MYKIFGRIYSEYFRRVLDTSKIFWNLSKMRFKFCLDMSNFLDTPKYYSHDLGASKTCFGRSTVEVFKTNLCFRHHL